MRFISCAVALIVTSATFADRLILIPTGKKILTGGLRYDVLTISGKDTTLGWLGTGIGQTYDIEITGEAFDSNKMVNGIDFSYNYTVPIMDLSPGISVGFQDATNVTQRGRNAYLAVTYRFGNSGEHNQDVPTELTFGFWSKEKSLIFAGANLPLSEPLSLIAEHDSENLTAGIELTPFRGGSFRVLFREHETLLGLKFFAQF